MRVINDATGGPIAALLDRGETQGCIDLSEVDELAQALELEDDDVGKLYEQLESRGIDLRDDCGREAEPAPLDDAGLASATPATPPRGPPAPPPTRCSSSSTKSAATGC